MKTKKVIKATVVKAKRKLTQSRNIQTTFYGNSRKVVIQVNLAVHSRKAVLHAVDHMQMNKYSAFVAEVHDLVTAELHAVITRSVTGRISIVFSRDPANPTCVKLN